MVVTFSLFTMCSFAPIAAAATEQGAMPGSLVTQINELGESNPATLAPMLKLVAFYRSGGQYVEALNWSEKALANCQKTFGDNHQLTNSSKASLAVDYRNTGKYGLALSLDEEVLTWRLLNLGEKNPDTLASYSNLAADYRRLGQYDKAEQLDDKSLKLRQEVLGENHSDTLISMNNLAADYRKLGKYEEALELDNKVLGVRIKELGENHKLTLTSLNNVAGDYGALGRYTEAAELHRKAVDSSTKLLGEKHPDTLVTLTNLALDYSRLGRYSETLPLEEKILKIRTEVLGAKHVDTLISANNLAGDYYTQGRYDEAAEKMQSLVDGVEELRQAGDLSPENRQTLFAQWIPSYKNYSLICFEQKKYDKAFNLSEMTKARTLLELTANRFADSSKILAPEEAKTMAEYQNQLTFLNEKITTAFDQVNERIKLETEKREVLNRYEQYRTDMMAKYPKYKKLSEVMLVDAATGAKLLEADSVFISYMVTSENKGLVFVIDPLKGLTTVSLGQIPKLNDMAQVYHDLLSYRDINQLSEAGKYLWKYPDGSFILTEGMTRPDETVVPVKDNKAYYEAINQISKMLADRLLVPIIAELKDKRRWIISTDGGLSLVPFETLLINDKMVVIDRDVSYIQSLSTLALLKERGQEQKENGTSLFVMGAAYYQGTTKYSASNLRLRGNGLQDLKSSEPEMDALAQIFKDSQQSIYKREDSTEAKLQELNKSHELEKYRYIVFSAHGYFDDKQPNLNAIVLGQKNLAPGTDGFVTVSKWPAYDLNSNLVYLSACETGRGQFVPGEGTLGLTYALFVAGNKNTIATLWKTMDDDSAVKFTSTFFAKVRGGTSQVQALSETKREFISDGKYSRAVFWAPFLLYGM